jgi:hypothetical protein
MTATGFIVMPLSVGTVIILCGWCIYKVLTTPEETKKVHGVELMTPTRNEPKQANP